jgi:hypothetical protein
MFLGTVLLSTVSRDTASAVLLRDGLPFTARILMRIRTAAERGARGERKR